MSFEVQRKEIDGLACFQFVGQIDEEAQFPTVTDMPGEAIIDLASVSSINSVGIRAWIMWFGQFEPTNFIFINCPKALVMQMNMVEGFLPPKNQVRSMEVPFFCEETDEEKDVMFTVGKEIIIENGNVKLVYDKASICGPDCDPELDVSEVKFFRFLLNKAESEAA